MSRVVARWAMLGVCLSAALHAQSVWVLPGRGSSVGTFASDPFKPRNPVAGPSGAFTALANLTATQFYLVSSEQVLAVDAAGTPVQPPIVPGRPIKAAAMSPDGKGLVVAAGDPGGSSVYLYDITGPTVAVVGSVNVGAGVLDLAISLDSSTAFVLYPENLINVGLKPLAIGAPIPLPGAKGPRAGVSAGANGLIYVTAPDTLYEVEPHSLAVRNTIAIPGFPGKPVFTPDGRALVPNPGASNSSHAAVAVLDLATDRVVGSLKWFGPTVDQILFASKDWLYLYSSSHSRLYRASTNLGDVQEAAFNGRTLGNVVSAFTTNELPNQLLSPGPRFLFVETANTLYRVDLNPPAGAGADQVLQSLPLASAGPAFYFEPASTGTPVFSYGYNTNQTIDFGGLSAPLVVRGVDVAGKPTASAQVRYIASVPARITGMPLTNRDGLAQAVAAAPDLGTDFTVKGQVGTAPATVFHIALGAGVNPTAPPPPGLSITHGNGQFTRGASSIAEPLVVGIHDDFGNPVSGVPVAFQVSAGQGTFLAPGCTMGLQSLDCITDTDGNASLFFFAGSVDANTDSFVQSIITASAGDYTTAAYAGKVDLTVTAVPEMAGDGQSVGPLPGYRVLTPATGVTIKGQAGQTLSGAVKVLITAQSGPAPGPIPNVSLEVRDTRDYTPGAAAPPAACQGGAALSGQDGLASCDLVLGPMPGTYDLFAVLGGNIPVPIKVEIGAGPSAMPAPALIQVVEGDKQTGTPGDQLSPLVVAVLDQFGNPIPNAAVDWVVSEGGATLVQTNGGTDDRGRATAVVQLGSTLGTSTILVGAGEALASLTVTTVAQIGGMAKLSGDRQIAATGQAFQPLVVKLTDNAGAPVAGAVVHFSVTSGNAAPASLDVETDPDGAASASFTASNTAGPVVITAGSANRSVTFNLQARAAGVALTASSFLNTASLQPGVAFGSLVTIRGDGLTTGLNLTPGTCISGAPGGSLDSGLPTRLAGIEIQFGSLLAPIFAVCRTADNIEQVNVQAPFELAPATITVLVRTGIGTPQAKQAVVPGVQILPALPGIFESGAQGQAMAVVVRPDGSVVSASNPARRGETLSLTATGLGPVLPSAGTNRPGVHGQVPFFTPVLAVDGKPVPGVTAEYAERLIGVFVVNFAIPPDGPASSSVPITLSVASPDGIATYPGSTSHIPVE